MFIVQCTRADVNGNTMAYSRSFKTREEAQEAYDHYRAIDDAFVTTQIMRLGSTIVSSTKYSNGEVEEINNEAQERESVLGKASA